MIEIWNNRFTKQHLYDLINKSTDPLLRTFCTLWDERDYWSKFPPYVFVEGNSLCGLIAYTVNDKYKDAVKIYYLYVDEACRGNSIGKKLCNFIFDKFKSQVKYFLYVTDITTDGKFLFERFRDDIFSEVYEKQNEFNGTDIVYKIDMNKPRLFEI